MQGLKSKVLKGGIYLTLRQLVSNVLSIVSVLVIARVLGPENYGIVAIALGIFYFLSWTTKVGLPIYLVRQSNLDGDAPKAVLSFFNTAGVMFCVVLWLCAPLLGWWTNRAEVTDVVHWLPLPLWFDMVASVSIAMLERELKFAEVGLIETVAQISNYLLSIPLVLLGWGYWGPIAGIILQFSLLSAIATYYYPIPWRLQLEWKILKPALQFGIGYSGSSWLLNLKALTVPLVISRLAGVEAAGIAGFSIRFVEQLSILRWVIKRMSISVLARLSGNLDAIRSTITKGMAYQALLIGPVCAVFSCFSAWIIPLLFGEKWLPSIYLFPLVAIATLVNSVFDMHSSALYAAGHNRDVAKQNAAYILLLWLSCSLLLPRFGVWGYGLAELVALPSFVLIHTSLTKLYGSPNYHVVVWLILATLPPLFAGAFFPQGWGFAALAISYGLLLLCNRAVRSIPIELYSTWRSKKQVSAT
ncbi:oligosaccharide flippase family protein [Leptolyngbya sp. AN02str]|uniref:oligosaccharide flippase family protein n=1 Tax=Leptolyngbya sp. AN02str TaxID=3423363 RepID=UPI003D30F78F